MAYARSSDGGLDAKAFGLGTNKIITANKIAEQNRPSAYGASPGNNSTILSSIASASAFDEVLFINMAKASFRPPEVYRVIRQ
jgi:hypothetical protein